MQIVEVANFNGQIATLHGPYAKSVTLTPISRKGDRRRFVVSATENGKLCDVFADATFTGDVMPPYKKAKVQVFNSSDKLVNVPKKRLPHTAVFQILDDMQYPGLTGEIIFLQVMPTEQNGEFVPWQLEDVKS